MADLKDKSIKAPAFLNAEDVLNPEATQGVTNEQVVEYLQAIGGACQTLQGALPPKTVTIATGKIVVDRYDIVVDLDIESDNLISIIEPEAFVSKIDVSTVINDGSYIMLRADKTKNIKLVNNASADDNSIKLLTDTDLLIDEKGVLLQRSASSWVQIETATGGVKTVNGTAPDENGNVAFQGYPTRASDDIANIQIGERGLITINQPTGVDLIYTLPNSNQKFMIVTAHFIQRSTGYSIPLYQFPVVNSGSDYVSFGIYGSGEKMYIPSSKINDVWVVRIVFIRIA